MTCIAAIPLTPKTFNVNLMTRSDVHGVIMNQSQSAPKASQLEFTGGVGRWHSQIITVVWFGSVNE